MKKLILLAVLIFGAILAYYYYFGNATNNYKIDLFNKKQAMVLTSAAFTNNSEMPSKYTCDGVDINPPLTFSNVPIDSKSLALTLDDPDAPGGFTHWIIFNLQPQSSGLTENAIVEGSVLGINDFGTKGYGGPCPQIGEHHYVFTLYALSDFITLPEGSTKKQLLDKIQNITLQTAVLTGLYKKQ